MKPKTYHLDPISKDSFFEHWDTKRVETTREYKSLVKFFKPYIDVIPKTVLGEYYWQIFNNDKPFPKILRVGGAVEKLTPTNAEGLLTMPIEEFFTFFHPNDLGPTMAFIIKVFEALFSIDVEKRNNFNFNIIARVRNSEGNYQWNSIQYPALYFDSEGNFLYGMVLYTNINHLIKDGAEPMLTILDLYYPTKPSRSANLLPCPYQTPKRNNWPARTRQSQQADSRYFGNP
jgi:hypothetical protein